MLHLMWQTKSMLRVLEGPLAIRIGELVHECSEINHWNINKFKVEGDCVYLEMEMVFNISVDKVVEILKKGTDKVLKQEFSDLEEWTFGKTFWDRGYFASLSGDSKVERKQLDKGCLKGFNLKISMQDNSEDVLF